VPDFERHGERCRIRLKHRLSSLIITTPMRERSMLPWYTPLDYRVPVELEALSAHFTQQAQHVRERAACPRPKLETLVVNGIRMRVSQQGLGPDGAAVPRLARVLVLVAPPAVGTGGRGSRRGA
jgi:hypothetical protein